MSWQNEFRKGFQRVVAILEDRAAFALVEPDLGSTEPDVRTGAWLLIGELQLKDRLPLVRRQWENILAKKLSGDEIEVARAVLWTLSRIGEEPDAVQMVHSFERVHPDLMGDALEVIGMCGARSAECREYLLKLARPDAPFQELRADAINCLSQSAEEGGRDLALALAPLMKDRSEPVACAAAEAVTRLVGKDVYHLLNKIQAPSPVRAAALEASLEVPNEVLTDALQSDDPQLREAAILYTSRSERPAAVLKDLLRIFSSTAGSGLLRAEDLMYKLEEWNRKEPKAVAHAAEYALRRLVSHADKICPPRTAGPESDIDKMLRNLKEALVVAGTPQILESLVRVLSGKGLEGDVMRFLKTATDVDMRLNQTVRDVLEIQDERVRKRVVSEIRDIEPGVLVQARLILEILPPLQDRTQTALFRKLRDVAHRCQYPELQIRVLCQLAALEDNVARAQICELILKGPTPRQAMLIRGLGPLKQNRKLRETAMEVVQKTEVPDVYQAALDALVEDSAEAVVEVMLRRLPSLQSSMRAATMMALGRLGDRVHLPVFLREMQSGQDDRILSGLLAVDRMINRSLEIPIEPVEPALYKLMESRNLMIRASALGILLKLSDPNAYDHMEALLKSESSLPPAAHMLIDEIGRRDGLPEPSRQKLIKAALVRLGLYKDEEAALLTSIKSLLAGRSLLSLMADKKVDEDVKGLRDLLKKQAEAPSAALAYRVKSGLQRLAIMFVDLTGYTAKSAAMSAIEIGVFLVNVEDEIAPAIRKHGGRLVKRLGDGFLFSFDTSASAVAGGLEALLTCSRNNRVRQEADRVRLRIGIHTGEVLVDRGDVFGDTVNMAARLEQIARPMCLYFSRDVYLDLPNKSAVIKPVGRVLIKGKEQPVEVYALMLESMDQTLTSAMQSLIGMPDLEDRINKLADALDKHYRDLSEKLTQARDSGSRGDKQYAAKLLDEIEQTIAKRGPDAD